MQDGGSDWRTWRILDIASGKLLPEELKWLKFNEPAWTADSRGFFYGRFDEPQAGQEFQSLNLNQKIYYHRWGSRSPATSSVFARPDQPSGATAVR